MLRQVLRQKSDKCFTKGNVASCGNGVVEKGEQCDPGLQSSPCCKGCQLTSGSQCEVYNNPKIHCSMECGYTFEGGGGGVPKFSYQVTAFLHTDWS